VCVVFVEIPLRKMSDQGGTTRQRAMRKRIVDATKRAFKGSSSRRRQNDEDEPMPPPPPSQEEIWRTKFASFKSAPKRWMYFVENEKTARYLDIIKFHNLKRFVAKPDEAHYDVVREFMIGLMLTGGSSSLVNGVEVPFNSHVINRHYHLANIPEHQDALLPMLDWKKNDPRFYEIEHTLCHGFDFEYKGKNPGTIFKTYFSQEAMVWRLFLQGRVFYTTNFKECTRLHQLVLFCLLTKKKFDIGKAIQREILEVRKELRTKSPNSLLFPSLITALCRNVGVPMLGQVHQRFPAIDDDV
jgi:Putative plant transposon protein